MSDKEDIQITLSTWERVHAAMAVGSQTGTVARIKVLTGILDILELDDGERLMTGWTSDGTMMVNWSQNLEWKLEFTKDQWDALCGVVVPFDRWPVHRNVDPMITKLTEVMLLKKANDPG